MAARVALDVAAEYATGSARAMAPAVCRYARAAFHRAYSAGRHTAHGRYPAATAVCSSAKNTRFLTY